MDALDLLQWPAMTVTVVASWLVSCDGERRRCAGFWLFLLSNLLWIVWGAHAHAYAAGLSGGDEYPRRKEDRKQG